MNGKLRGHTALVTGASSGLGVEFARELASRGADLILVARREAALREVAQRIEADCGRQIAVIAADLGQAAERQSLLQQIEARGLNVDLLVNNAGFGLYGSFAGMEWARSEQMLQVDIVALSHLTRALLPAMIQRRFGRVLLIGSTGSFQPSPGYAAYAAAKAYVLSFGVALNHELRGTGVSCTTVCPGVTRTEFLQVSGQAQNWFHRATMMESAAVARIGVDAMLAGRAQRVTGWFNAVSAFSTRLMPRTWAAATAAQVMKN
ncbi:MAG: SDR family oxidoreductase [Gammaproteobacteria bacterium]|nr:SDR family oxidoreductase [Gammaproteobacteria bacterium]